MCNLQRTLKQTLCKITTWKYTDFHYSNTIKTASAPRALTEAKLVVSQIRQFCYVIGWPLWSHYPRCTASRCTCENCRNSKAPTQWQYACARLGYYTSITFDNQTFDSNLGLCGGGWVTEVARCALPLCCLLSQRFRYLLKYHWNIIYLYLLPRVTEFFAWFCSSTLRVSNQCCLLIQVIQNGPHIFLFLSLSLVLLTLIKGPLYVCTLCYFLNTLLKAVMYTYIYNYIKKAI